MRLIDADALKAHYAWWGDTEERRTFDAIVDLQPTVDAVVLLCKVGDTVWRLNDNGEITEMVVKRILMHGDYMFHYFAECKNKTAACSCDIDTMCGAAFTENGMDEIRLFLTREAAEAALDAQEGVEE